MSCMYSELLYHLEYVFVLEQVTRRKKEESSLDWVFVAPEAKQQRTH